MHLNIFFASTSKTSHFKSILSRRESSFILKGKLPLTESFPFLLTLPSREPICKRFELTRSVPPRLVIGFRSNGEDIVALWKEAEPSSTGCSTVPRTYRTTNQKTKSQRMGYTFKCKFEDISAEIKSIPSNYSISRT